MRQVIIPMEFVLRRTRLNWREARYGMDRGWLDPESMIDLALSALEEKEDNEPLVARLAGLRENERWEVPELVEKLAGLEGEYAIEEAKRKFLCLILAWLYENRSAFDNPFSIIDEIYDDFDYPDEVKGFVSYMPVGEPSSMPPYTTETPKERLLRLWKEYVDTCHDKIEETS